MSTTQHPTPADLQRMLDVMRDEYAAAPAKILEILRQPRGDWKHLPVRTGFGGELFLAETLQRKDGVGFNGQLVRLTQDGEPCFGETWSTAPECSGEDTYFEVWDVDLGRRTAHGYVDSVTRYLVQTG